MTLTASLLLWPANKRVNTRKACGKERERGRQGERERGGEKILVKAWSVQEVGLDEGTRVFELLNEIGDFYVDVYRIFRVSKMNDN